MNRLPFSWEEEPKWLFRVTITSCDDGKVIMSRRFNCRDIADAFAKDWQGTTGDNARLEEI